MSIRAWQAVTIVAVALAGAAIGTAVVALNRSHSTPPRPAVSATEQPAPSEPAAAQRQALLEQGRKAGDASAKELARTAETTAETLATDHNGSYVSVEPKTLHELENSIPLEEVAGSAFLSAATGEANGYSVTATAGEGSGDTFTIKNSEGVISRTCKPGGEGGCPSSETW
jgi:hypothetical protein